MISEIEFIYKTAVLYNILAARLVLLDTYYQELSYKKSEYENQGVNQQAINAIQGELFRLDNQRRTIVLYQSQLQADDDHFFKTSDQTFQQLATLLDLPNNPFTGA